ncbi:hypothetical protein [Sphingopyxis macrogoltabida]|uniref:Uncharacterized protein n=1 Tax=Sphingopyxis macrogoltabida TaxID=33050 RepID=A0AAC9AW17_SPHMC|nr:hypothetical protein [Sphingopyxis macrogoltabida]ALJ14077.1 hypothetical protein LH19_14480 [Sphingopyxis macrogoltabida]AMU90349.1 hypothetical protein ATM17_15085 [Sphingopyxis macrogoltabida]
MADYHSPTIVRPDIPRAAMTLLEHRLLIGMFSHEGGEDEVYFFAEDYVNDLLHLDLAEVHQLLEVDPFPDSYAVTAIRDHLRKLDPAEGELALDMSVIGYEGIFQDIIKRCDALDDVEVVAAWTCTKMRPDGFGGMATLITADAIKTMSTASFLDEVRNRLRPEELANA